MTLAPLPDLYSEGYWERGEGSNYVTYGDDPGWASTAAVLRQATSDVAVPTLFEAACAKGWFLAHAIAAGFDARGMDLSEWATTHRAPVDADRILCGDVATADLPAGPFDVVCSWEFLEHVPETHIDAALDRLGALARPGGLLIHRVGIAYDDGADHGHDHDSTHVLMRTREWWAKRLAQGFDHRPDVEQRLDEVFAGRDWVGRFFAHQRPNY